MEETFVEGKKDRGRQQNKGCFQMKLTSSNEPALYERRKEHGGVKDRFYATEVYVCQSKKMWLLNEIFCVFSLKRVKGVWGRSVSD